MEINAPAIDYRQEFYWKDDLIERKNRWLHYNVAQLSYDECKRLSENLTADSRCETAKSVLYGLVGMAAHVAMAVLAVLIFIATDRVLSFFGLELVREILGTPAFVMIAYLGILMISLIQCVGPILLKALYFWEHSNHLDEQERACAARMRLLEAKRV